MKLERSNIEFPLWRKKVDKSLLEDKETPIPKFLWLIWGIEELFSQYTSSKDPRSSVNILFNKTVYSGAIHKKANGQFKFVFSKELSNELKNTYVMSYMRFIEERLRKGKLEYSGTKIEDEIPFWEFLDLEFDKASKTMYLTSHYVQKPLYLELFKEIVKSNILVDIENKLNAKTGLSISKHDWKEKSNLPKQLDVKNVIYNLIDLTNKEIYIGEAESLNKRLKGSRTEIANWEYYRYDSLPNDLTKNQRLAIERLIIRTFASFLANAKGIPSMEISEFRLMNKKIDL